MGDFIFPVMFHSGHHLPLLPEATDIKTTAKPNRGERDALLRPVASPDAAFPSTTIPPAPEPTAQDQEISRRLLALYESRRPPPTTSSQSQTSPGLPPQQQQQNQQHPPELIPQYHHHHHRRRRDAAEAHASSHPHRQTTMHGTAHDLIFLFGDSITQRGSAQDNSGAGGSFGWVAAMEDAYIRRLGVINAGLSGYGTDKALSVMNDILPPPPPPAVGGGEGSGAGGRGRIRLLTIFFGANDARLPNSHPAPQHVPLGDFKRNLRRMVAHPRVREHAPRIVLITPPPVEERLCEAVDLANGFGGLQRRADVTRGYARAVIEVAEELAREAEAEAGAGAAAVVEGERVDGGRSGAGGDIAVLDLWTAFMRRAGWTPGGPLLGVKRRSAAEGLGGLSRLLRDGLHLTGEGNRVVFQELMALVRERWPELAPEGLEFVLPKWDDVEGWRRRGV